MLNFIKKETFSKILTSISLMYRLNMKTTDIMSLSWCVSRYVAHILFTFAIK